MARKSRYVSYYKAANDSKRHKGRSTKSSILGRLKELKGQEFVTNLRGDGGKGTVCADALMLVRQK